jgi:long-chain acyl-CoA synthetase
MLKSNFIILENVNGTVNEKNLDLVLNNDVNREACDFELVSYSDKYDFIKNYITCLNDNKTPVVVNSGLPELIKQNIYNKIKNNYLNNKSDRSKVKKSLGHILCSSGTTSQDGIPKSYFFEIDKSLMNAKAHYDSLNINEELSVLFPLPLSHSFGVVVGILGSFVTASHTYIYDQMPSPVSLVKDVEKYNIDLLYLTPTMVRMILKLKKFIKLKGDGPRFISIGSSPLYKNELLELMDMFKKSEIFFTYGLTEAGPRVATLSCGNFNNKNIALENSNLLPLGKPLVGVEFKFDNNLFIKSDYAYLSDFFDSEDKIDKSLENIYLKGRADYVIISGGVNIYPDEVEALVDNISGVERSCLVGLTSKLYGEVPVLCYVRNDKVDSPSQDMKSIINDTLVKKLPSTHVPHDIIELNNIATTSLGKVMRSKVVSMLKEKDDRKSD